ncbi:MAG TPA: pyridoxal phosphate-dependent aminotransferase [Thermoanaerobaculia bacterium]
MFSRRADWHSPTNTLTLARDAARARGEELFDLTETNPTRAGLDYPLDEIAEALARGARAAYDPDPRGLLSAREALAAHLGCPVGDLLITASTSEAYSYLFKLLTDPGDSLLTATPSYPLLEHLAALELVTLSHFPLEFHARWEIDFSRLAVSPRDKAVVVVNPNNPTGSFVTPAEADRLASLGLPLISDEVFLDYALESRGTSIVRDDVLTFTLGGLSKSAGLPHLKLGWIRVSGPAAARRDALAALELIADNFLSVATPVQIALPELLRLAPRVRALITERTRHNLDVLSCELAPYPAAHLLPVEGGWSAVIRMPRIKTDEELALELLKRGVVVQPGYFFDFESDGWVVVSLLTQDDVFAEGARRLAEMVPA